PWSSADKRRTAARNRAGQLYALKLEKRALVKELIGFEWDNHADEVWNHDPTLSLTVGFLSDEKATRVQTLLKKYDEAAAAIREEANFVIIDADRARLRSTYDRLLAELSQVLTSAELDEYRLRFQAIRFFFAHDLHFDGVAVTRAELREIARLSQSVRDYNRDDFSDTTLPEAEGGRRLEQFERQLKALLNPGRYADFERARDFNFRETLAFARNENLPPALAINLHNAQRVVEDESARIRSDPALSADQQATALAALETATNQKLRSMLGPQYQKFIDGPGTWAYVVKDQSEPIPMPPVAPAP
ncbi:MAG: hypothetical protein H7Y43_02685, partial [Akkermansiaceae bacterium]|nr:hypothetical protein [Verrucomicrobiales bacterium]